MQLQCFQEVILGIGPTLNQKGVGRMLTIINGVIASLIANVIFATILEIKRKKK